MDRLAPRLTWSLMFDQSEQLNIWKVNPPLQWRDWPPLVLDFHHPVLPSPCIVLLLPVSKKGISINWKKLGENFFWSLLTSSTSRVTPSLLVCTPQPPDLNRKSQHCTFFSHQDTISSSVICIVGLHISSSTCIVKLEQLRRHRQGVWEPRWTQQDPPRQGWQEYLQSPPMWLPSSSGDDPSS